MKQQYTTGHHWTQLEIAKNQGSLDDALQPPYAQLINDVRVNLENLVDDAGTPPTVSMRRRGSAVTGVVNLMVVPGTQVIR